MFKAVRKNLKRCVSMLGVLVILALMMVPVFADNVQTVTINGTYYFKSGIVVSDYFSNDGTYYDAISGSFNFYRIEGDTAWGSTYTNFHVYYHAVDGCYTVCGSYDGDPSAGLIILRSGSVAQADYTGAEFSAPIFYIVFTNFVVEYGSDLYNFLYESQGAGTTASFVSPPIASGVPEVTVDDDGNIVSVPVYLVVQPGDVYNGYEFPVSDLVFLGNFGAGDIVSWNEVQHSGYYVSSYMFQCRFLNVDIENVYYSSTSSVIVNGSWLRVMTNVVNETFVASGMRILIFPQFEPGVDGEDDDYHSAAFIRVINALWQNFYTSFVQLTSQMNFFGISVLSVLGILVTVFVVVTIVKIFHGGS